MLSGINIGTLFAWGVVIVAIITAAVKAITKLYQLFTTYKKLKDENKKMTATVQEHEETLKEIHAALKEIKGSLNEQKEVNLKQIRHTIVHSCYDALAAGEIQIGKLKSLEEMFQEYTDMFHANGYVKGLVTRVRELPIVGTLDE